MKYLLFILLLASAACSKEDKEPSVVTGASSEAIVVSDEKILTSPDWTKLFPPRPDATVPGAATETTTTSTQSKTDECSYNGRYNGDRPTWYCPKKMASYPGGTRVIVDGCYDVIVSNTSKRYEKGGLIFKQSDVSGRGAAIVAASSCKGKTARVKY